ncbi:MAG: hypothetical protein J6V92_07730 [Bacteroidaceae bacterium]|nr:hypothetical protein [Bacteroidaceae bacterium]
MKKTYKEPTMLIVTIQHTSLLMGSLDNKVGGNADMNYGGGKGDTEGRVKEHSIWEDDW